MLSGRNAFETYSISQCRSLCLRRRKRPKELRYDVGKCNERIIRSLFFYSTLCSIILSSQADITPDQIFTLLASTGNDKVEPYYPIIFCGFLKHPSQVAALIANPTAGGGGGGGGGGDGGGEAAEEKEEEKPVEEEMDMGGGMDMFGGDEAEGGGDY
jgi:large subunit ribosomal protein LP1